MKKTTLLFTAALLCAATARAALMIEDFNARSTGALTETGSVADVFITSNTSLDVVEDTGNLFGLGTSNKYLRITDDNGTNGPFVAFDFGGPLDTADGGTDDNAYSIRFDFIDNSTGSGRLDIRGRTSPTDGNNEGFDPRLVTGTLYSDTNQDDGVVYSQGVLYSMQIDVTDETAGLFDVYVLSGNTIIQSITGANFRDNGSDNILDTVTMQSFNGDTGTDVLIDNIQIGVTAIPEPSSLALIMICGAAGALVLRRRR